MASQKSIEAVAPKRQRGRERVAAILDAAAQLFIEQGQAVTMTEIAARSGTAIGSLYRFFPTREPWPTCCCSAMPSTCARRWMPWLPARRT